jgi:hypothetical protein
VYFGGINNSEESAVSNRLPPEDAILLPQKGFTSQQEYAKSHPSKFKSGKMLEFRFVFMQATYI